MTSFYVCIRIFRLQFYIHIFNQNPYEFKNKILNLKQLNKVSFHKQPCET
jgi:hypothetical protein